MTELSVHTGAAGGELERRLEALPRQRRAVYEQLLAGRTVVHEVSDAQRGIWFIDRLMPGSALYVVAWRCQLRGQLDVVAFGRAVDRVVARHEALRTRFELRDGRAVQVVQPRLHVPVRIEDVRSDPGAADGIAAEEAATGFDLSAGPLLRVRLLRTAAETHELLLCAHHIVFDGVSTQVFLRELMSLYAADVTGTTLELPAVAQYSGFADDQRHRMAGDAGERLAAFWREQLAGAPAVLDLPTARIRPPVPDHAGRTVRFSVPNSDVAAMGRLAGQQHCSPFMAYVAVLQLLLARYSGQPDVSVGTPAANRDPEWATTIGMCANIIVLRTRVAETLTFRQLLDEVRIVCLDAYDHQQFAFEQVVEAVAPERSLSHNPLFQVACALAGEFGIGSSDGPVQLTGLDAVPASLAKFDLSVAGALVPAADGVGLTVTVEHRTDVIDETLVGAFTADFAALWRAAAEHPDVPVAELPLAAPPVLPSIDADLVGGLLDIRRDDVVAIVGDAGAALAEAARLTGQAAGATLVPCPSAADLPGSGATVAWLPVRVARLLPRETFTGLRLLVTDPGPLTMEVDRHVVVADRRVGLVAVGGSAVAGLRVSVLDEAGRPVPNGLYGILHAGGHDLDRLAAVRDGVLVCAGERPYRGGVRTAAMAITDAVLTHPNLRDAAVTGGSGGWTVHAVAVPGAAPSLRDLQAFLADRLPRYLVPGTLSIVDRLPLDADGMLDAAALPAGGDPAGHRVRREPATALERLLVSVWRELFDGAEIGAEDNFFDLGGHSLLAVRMLGMLTELLGVELSISVLFGTPTPAALAVRIGELLGDPDEAEQLAVTIEEVLALPEDEVERRLAALPGI
jgi:hypothetical protein